MNEKEISEFVEHVERALESAETFRNRNESKGEPKETAYWFFKGQVEAYEDVLTLLDEVQDR
jgi:hypothetical protein